MSSVQIEGKNGTKRHNEYVGVDDNQWQFFSPKFSTYNQHQDCSFRCCYTWKNRIMENSKLQLLIREHGASN